VEDRTQQADSCKEIIDQFDAKGLWLQMGS
jgi:hypothetical protein